MTAPRRVPTEVERTASHVHLGPLATVIARLGVALEESRREVQRLHADNDRLRQRGDMATDQRADARRIVEEARMEASALLNMEREHLGAGRDGHISEVDLIPLLRALQIDTEEKP